MWGGLSWASRKTDTLLFHMLKLILLKSAKIHCMYTILSQSSPPRICRRGGENIWTENQIWGWWWWKGWQQCQSFYTYLTLLLLQSFRKFLPMPPCSCLPCGISVGEKKSSPWSLPYCYHYWYRLFCPYTWGRTQSHPEMIFFHQLKFHMVCMSKEA